MIRINRPPDPLPKADQAAESQMNKLAEQLTTSPSRRIHFDENLVNRYGPFINEIFSDKCAFCETGTSYTENGNIYHFRPHAGCRTGSDKGAKFLKLHYSWLAYDWDNLYLICNVCNKYRRDYFPLADESTRAELFGSTEREQRLLIDPCVEDPSEHLKFLEDGTIVGISQKGTTSIELYGLNRAELTSQRKVAINRFLHDYDRTLDDKELTAFELFVYDLFSPSTKVNFAGALRAIAREHRIVPGKSVSLDDELEVLVESVEEAEPSGASPEPEVVFSSSEIKNFSIRRIEIKNFKSIEHLSLEVQPSAERVGGEAWLLLLGDNGIGKSSILQAIALALCGQNAINRMNEVLAKDILRNHTRNGFVKVWSYESDEVIFLQFDKKSFYSSIKESPTYLLAYGSTRLLPKGKLEARTPGSSMINIANLFDYSVALIDVNTWLNKLSKTANGRVELEQRVLPALMDLIDLELGASLSFTKGALHFVNGSDDHLLEEVSDGFKSVIGLAADIMMSLSGDIGGYHSTQGIVLIDELGNHLHPRWRMKIVSALRRAFPNLQFIVSTHEPLCLRGLAHGEVVVLLLKEKKLHLLEKKELPDHNMLRVDQLLTSDLFGLINILDEQTEKQYEEYYGLLTIPEDIRSDEEQARVNFFTQSLSEKELIGATPKDQVLFEIVNETWASKINQDGFKTVGELKTETIKEVKAILEEKKPDWL